MTTPPLSHKSVDESGGFPALKKVMRWLYAQADAGAFGEEMELRVGSDSLGACASNSCSHPATVRMFHRLPDAMALVRTFCDKHAKDYESLGWER